MSFFAELRRRNVFRVGIAYLVVGWLVMQIADVIINNIEAPDWVFQVIMLLLGIGFPIVMIFAWAFEMTPEGIKKEKDVDRSQSITSKTGRKLDRRIIGILVVVVGYLLIDKLILQDPATVPVEITPIAVAEPETSTETGPSVAVLPFVNMSGDKENEYFSDGLTETLLHMLAQLPGLRVAARTSSFAFKGQNKSISEIAGTLGVANILEGSVQKSGDRIRVTAQLIRAEDGFHIWSQNYTRPLEDIFAIQDEIASDVATALDASLLGHAIPDLKGVATSDLAAYDVYLKGLEQQVKFSYGSLNIAEDYFRQSLARDPGFTDARLSLIRNYLLKNLTGVINEQTLRVLAEPLIRQIREQHPDNRMARAFEISMDLLNFRPQYGKKEIRSMVTELRNMLPLIPNESLVRISVALTLNFYFEEERDAVEVLEAGLLIDPLSGGLYRALGIIQTDHDRLEDALVTLLRAQELAPENPNIYGSLGQLERKRNNLSAALNWERMAIEVDPQDHELAAALAQDLYYLKLPEEGDRWLARVRALVPGSAIARMVELDRAVAKDDLDHALALAKSMIADQVDTRRGTFFNAATIYVDLMLKFNRGKEASKFLISVKPEIANYDTLPDSFQGLSMQWCNITLMSGFESFETRQDAWLKLVANLDAKGFPWRNPEEGNLIYDLVITGDLEAATEHFLNVRLSQPMASDLQRHKRQLEPLFGQVYSDPRVAARLAELDREFEQMREEVGELMLEPEWNQ